MTDKNAADVPNRSGKKSITKEVKQRRRELIKGDLDRFSDIATTILKWTVSSLLLLNGGALVAIAGVEDLRPILLRGPGWLFAGGIISVLLGAWLLMSAMAQAGENIMERIWSDDPLDHETYSRFSESVRPSIPVTFAGIGLISLSAVLFMLACLRVANTETNQSHRQAERPPSAVPPARSAASTPPSQPSKAVPTR